MSANKLFARSRTLLHPSGLKFHTPMLVPSFSSKGFPPSRDGKPWVSRLLETTSEWLTDKMLISAYDIHHGHIAVPAELPCKPELTIVDSGGYEAGLDQDLSAVAVREHQPKVWTPDDMKAVYDVWPDRFAAVLVSYDHPTRRIPLADQVAEARALFVHYPNQWHSLLVKPATKTQEYLKTVLDAVLGDPSQLAGFHVIGVTEKELGSSVLDRMQRIAELRLILDGAGNDAPIQVFGALDPLSACLYFISGAEIFDGLTWLRYAYLNGMCVYRANYGAAHIGLDLRDVLVDVKTMTDNISYLQRLEASMKRVALDDDVAHFPHHVDVFRQAFVDLRTRLKGRS
jgi:hypothetical protein